MPLDEVTSQRWRWFAFATVAFGLSYAVLPLYSSNQNHHLLAGIARAGEGWLIDDWMVHTVDPFPLFTAFVWLVHRYLSDTLYYLLYLLLLGAYAYGLMRVTEHICAPANSRTIERLLFLAAVCVLHNEVIGYLLGVDLQHLPWWQMTHWGVAEQEIFGHGMFQPSAVGLLLPLAIAWHLDGRPVRAAALIGAVVLVHFSYAVIGGCLVAAFMTVAWTRRRSLAAPVAIGAVALLFTLPGVVYVVMRLGPTSASTARQSAAILVDHIRQEADPHVWLGAKAGIQVAWMLSGVALAAGTDLFLPLLVPLLAGVALSSAQIASGNPQLALIFPWRVSVLLVPVATALVVRSVIATGIGRRALTARQRRGVGAAACAAIALSVAAGVVRMTLNFAYFYDDRPITAPVNRVVPDRWRRDFERALRPDTLPMMAFVKHTAVEGDLYVVPPELERFRLRTGAPIVADFKSHPYKDVEVLEWFTRLQLVETFYASADCGVLRVIANRYAITHVVLDDRVRQAQCPGVTRVYSDRLFDIGRVHGTADAKIGFSECCRVLTRFDPPVR